MCAKLLKGCAWLFMGNRLRATEHHLPYGSTHSYLSPNTGERILH